MSILSKTKTAATTIKEANWFKVLLMTSTVALGVLYIWQVNVAATSGFTMRDLDYEIEELQTDNERFQIEIAHLQSIDSVTTRLQMLGMTKIEDVNYISGSSAVAINR